MLTSINPHAERGRNQHYPITAAAFIVASTVGGAALGGVLGAAGSRVASSFAALLVVASVGAIGIAVDLGVGGARALGPRRQVDLAWLTRYRGWVYGAGFGVQLGLGFTTIVSASTTWVTFVCALLSGSPIGGCIIGATYGLVRAAPILTTARIREPGALRSLMKFVERLRPRMAAATTGAQCAAIIAALAVAFVLGAA
jgi:hypothetical protein